jgi:hypothetical protein
MTVQAVGVLTGVLRDNAHPGNFIATVQYAVIGQTGFSEQSYQIYNLDPTLDGALLQATLQSDLKTYLASIGVTFGLLDTVRILPGFV